MNRIAELDAIIEQYNLNKHPFYTEWREGTLPMPKLQDYANQYGEFVATIAAGWETLAQPKYAADERYHEELWHDFRTAIHAAEDYAPHPQTVVLRTAAEQMFRSAPECAGALYAFEAQQPHTSQVKLDGLKEHYSVPDIGHEYFRVHAGDMAEADLLRAHIEKLSDEDFARCKVACAVLAAAMWSALDGVYRA